MRFSLALVLAAAAFFSGFAEAAPVVPKEEPVNVYVVGSIFVPPEQDDSPKDIVFYSPDPDSPEEYKAVPLSGNVISPFSGVPVRVLDASSASRPTAP